MLKIFDAVLSSSLPTSVENTMFICMCKRCPELKLQHVLKTLEQNVVVKIHQVNLHRYHRLMMLTKQETTLMEDKIVERSTWTSSNASTFRNNNVVVMCCDNNFNVKNCLIVQLQLVVVEIMNLKSLTVAPNDVSCSKMIPGSNLIGTYSRIRKCKCSMH